MGGIANAIDIVQVIVSAGAIIVAGLWTYLLFIRKRIGYPHVKLSTEPVECRDMMGWRLIHVKLDIENVGNVILRAESAELRVRQVLPFPDAVQQSIDLGYDPVAQDRTYDCVTGAFTRTHTGCATSEHRL